MMEWAFVNIIVLSILITGQIFMEIIKYFDQKDKGKKENMLVENEYIPYVTEEIKNWTPGQMFKFILNKLYELEQKLKDKDGNS
jgi:hypothetical protein